MPGNTKVVTEAHRLSALTKPERVRTHGGFTVVAPLVETAPVSGIGATLTRLVVQGMSNPAVAQRLFLSRATVKTHVSNALTKLQLTSRVELAGAAARR